MVWRIDFTRNADKAMRKLDRGIAARIFEELDEIAKLEDPRVRGKSLTGNLAGVWRYRVGDYRILCDIDDGRLVILERYCRGNYLNAERKRKCVEQSGAKE